ncbi:helix-turn-helix domain-containing protein [Paenarthrobacter sp. AT5]|uniref:helix-turn-helix domain-containing protein n=1 Tax=Paenarthrobacter TaxID=1742992 RepID=UPI001A992486|nr:MULTISPECIES: helix-turn-helix domain-containing protein [Paenarthrobacter]QSZ53303.1 hypothetical protein AYX19_09980 [Paenarthrobacter ureafaciens]WOC59871.1 helix-turn-helix domain-containing protein [Paenarthrobacter sp. AT5]
MAPAVAQRLTVAEAAEAAHRHPVTVRRALEGGELHGTQRTFRGRWLIRAECLDAWLDGNDCVHRSNVVSLRKTG